MGLLELFFFAKGGEVTFEAFPTTLSTMTRGATWNTPDSRVSALNNIQTTDMGKISMISFYGNNSIIYSLLVMSLSGSASS